MDVQATVRAPTLAIRTGDSFLRNEEKAFMLDFGERSEQKKRPLVEVWDETFANYLVRFEAPYVRGRGYPEHSLVGARTFNTEMRARLKDPETHIGVETLCAQGIGLLFGNREYLQAIPVGADDPEKARMLSRLLMAVMEQPGFFRTIYQLFKDAFIFGTSIFEMGWETRSRFQYVPRPVVDSMGRLTGDRELVPAEVIYRDRPLLTQIDHYDFYPDPSGTRIQDNMVGAMKRFCLTNTEALRLLESGTYDQRDAVRRAIQRGSSMKPRTYGPADPGTDRQEKELLGTLPPPFGVMNGFEYQGEYPGRTSDGFSNRIITMLNGEIVRSYGNPYIDGNIRWKEMVVNPINGRFWGLAPAEVGRFLQDSADHFMMSLQDATNAAIRAPLLIGRGFNGDPEALRQARQNDILQVNDPDKARRVPQDTSTLALAMQELAQRRVTIARAMGSDGQMLPMPSSGARGGATEVNEIARLASQRGEAMISLVEKEDFPHIGRTSHSLLRQFVAPGDELIAVYAGERFSTSLEEIDVDADVRFVGSRLARTKDQLFSALQGLIQTIGTNPEALSLIPDVIVRAFRDGAGIEDADAIVARAQQALAAREAVAAARESEAKGQPVPSKPNAVDSAQGGGKPLR